MSRLIAILDILRSYAEGEFHPSRDPGYALVRGPSGKRRWHLVVPGSEMGPGYQYHPVSRGGTPSKEPYVVEPFKVPDMFEDLFSLGVKNVKLRQQKRVPIWLAEFPDYGGFIIKPVENDEFSEYPTTMTTAFKALGAPHVPYEHSWGYYLDEDSLSRMLGLVKTQRDRDRAEYLIQRNGLLISPYIEGSKFWETAGWGPPRFTPIPPAIETYLQRIEARNLATEVLMGAPDRHPKNYVKFPVLVGDAGTGPIIADIKTGMDYEWSLLSSRNEGLLHAERDSFEPAKTLEYLDQKFAKGRSWFHQRKLDPLVLNNPTVLGTLDVLDRVERLPSALEEGGANHKVVKAAEDLASHWNKEYDGPLRAIYEYWTESGKP